MSGTAEEAFKLHGAAVKLCNKANTAVAAHADFVRSLSVVELRKLALLHRITGAKRLRRDDLVAKVSRMYAELPPS